MANEAYWDAQLRSIQLEAKARQAVQELGPEELERQQKARRERSEHEQDLRRERQQLESKARARGDTVPSLLADPEAYVAWLQQERRRPWTEIAKANQHGYF